MESTDSSSGSQQQQRQPQLPPGFRFHPTDEELVVHYLKKKAASAPLPVTIIAEVDLYKFDPWELPGKATFGEQEWYFFSPRERKYPNGARPNRAATSGYWKATGTDKPILTREGTQKVGVKKALVFYGGKPPRGIKTNWIMHEYRLLDSNNSKTPPPPPPRGVDIPSKKSSLRLDDWVLCRIYKKNNSNRPMDRDKEDSLDDMLPALPTGPQNQKHQKPANYSALPDGDENFFQGLLTESGMNTHGHPNPMPQLSSSASSKPNLSMVAAAVSVAVPQKRALATQSYWNDVEPGPASKMFRSSIDTAIAGESSCNNSNSNSIATLLNQLPQGASPFHHRTPVGSIADGVFQQQQRQQPYQLSSMNWNC